MTKFKIGMRVKIIPQVICLAPPPPSKLQTRLAGKCGIVVRLKQRDDAAAWVRMEEDVPEELRVYGTIQVGRENDIILHDCECVEIK